MGACSKGGTLKIFLVVGRIPVEIFSLKSYVFDATLTIESMFFKGPANLFKIMAAFSFLAL